MMVVGISILFSFNFIILFKKMISWIFCLLKLFITEYKSPHNVKFYILPPFLPNLFHRDLTCFTTDTIILGYDNFADNIKEMIGHRPFIYWQVTWRFLTPIMIFVSIYLYSSTAKPLVTISCKASPMYEYPNPQTKVIVTFLAKSQPTTAKMLCKTITIKQF